MPVPIFPVPPEFAEMGVTDIVFFITYFDEEQRTVDIELALNVSRKLNEKQCADLRDMARHTLAQHSAHLAGGFHEMTRVVDLTVSVGFGIYSDKDGE